MAMSEGGSAGDAEDPKLKPGDEAAPGTPGTGENVCPSCVGSGTSDGKPCEECGGTGTVVAGIGGG